LGEGDYNGFELDGNGRFLLGDFTVTHNTTFLKQLKILYQTGFSEEERRSIRPSIYANIMMNINALLEASTSLKNVPPLATENQEIVKKFSQRVSFEEGAKYIKQLWKDPAIQHCYQRSSEFQLQDNCEYFFEAIDRVAQSDYIPSEEDVLQVRNKTTGITEVEMSISEHKWTVVDVGGQRSERRKWIHCFDDITGIIFFASLSEYDQKLVEDKMTNRMSESLKLFKDIANYNAFVTKNTPIILFLNKKDLFQKKITEVPLSVCFKNYTGPNEYNKACAFIRKEFLKLAPPNKEVHVFKTCATDSKNIRLIFTSVQGHIINANLNLGGLYAAPSTGRKGTNSGSSSGTSTPRLMDGEKQRTSSKENIKPLKKSVSTSTTKVNIQPSEENLEDIDVE